MSDLFSHLDELRRRVIVCLVVFSAASIICYFFSRQILDFLTWPLRQDTPASLYFQQPHEAFFIALKTAAFAGFFFSSPVIFTQAWLFVSPGLYEPEKKWLKPLIFISVILFLAGAAFSYAFVIPFGLKFLLSFQTESLKPILDIGSYFSFLTGMMLAFGILFIFPVIQLGLVRLGLVSTATLSRSRRIIIVLIFIAAAVLTPSPDPFSQLLLAIPLWGLFEISLLAARSIEKGRNPAL